MSRYLIGYFSRRQFFHIVAYRDSDEEVQAYLNTHNSKKLVVYASQQNAHADGAYWSCKNCGDAIHNSFDICGNCGTPRS